MVANLYLQAQIALGPFSTSEGKWLIVRLKENSMGLLLCSRTIILAIEIRAWTQERLKLKIGCSKGRETLLISIVKLTIRQIWIAGWMREMGLGSKLAIITVEVNISEIGSLTRHCSEMYSTSAEEDSVSQARPPTSPCKMRWSWGCRRPQYRFLEVYDSRCNHYQS